MIIPVTMVIPVGVSIITVAVRIGVTIVAIAMAIATDRNAPSQRQTNQKQDPKKNDFFIHTITPFLWLYLFRRVRGNFIQI